jgi:hypothetical protein
MAIDTERETEPEATAEGGLSRLDLPGSEPSEDEELAEDELDGS